MNPVKRALGILWMALGPLFLFFLVKTGIEQISKNPTLDTSIQWGIFILIFIPIAIGLVIFGYYAYKGEYEAVK